MTPKYYTNLAVCNGFYAFSTSDIWKSDPTCTFQAPEVFFGDCASRLSVSGLASGLPCRGGGFFTILALITDY